MRVKLLAHKRGGAAATSLFGVRRVMTSSSSSFSVLVCGFEDEDKNENEEDNRHRAARQFFSLNRALFSQA